MKGDEFLRHRERDTREIESAADFLRGSAQEGASLGDSFQTRIERVEADERLLRQWAQDQGKLGGALPLEQEGGYEHVVDFRRVDRDGHVEKATRPETELGYGALVEDNGATLGEYLFRLAQQNWMFGDAVRLERIVPVGGNKLSIVTSQPFIDAPDATLPEIDDFMVNTKGFERVGHGAYYDRQERILHWQTPRSALSSLQRGRAPRSAERDYLQHAQDQWARVCFAGGSLCGGWKS